MGFFDKLSALGKDLFADAERAFRHVTTRKEFAQVCQAAFLIARADGSFDPSEKAMLQKLIAAKLPQFGPRDILEAINDAEATLAFSVDAGVQMLLANIGAAKGTETAQLIMLVALAIAGADGNFDDDEKRVAREIATVLGLEPGKFGL